MRLVSVVWRVLLGWHHMCLRLSRVTCLRLSFESRWVLYDMCVSICVYLYVYIYMCVSICVYLYVCIYMCISTWHIIFTYVVVLFYRHLCTALWGQIFETLLWVTLSALLYVYIYMCISICVYLYDILYSRLYYLF